MSQLNDHTLIVKTCSDTIQESATVAFWLPFGAGYIIASDYHIQRIIEEYDNMRESIEYMREHLESSKE